MMKLSTQVLYMEKHNQEFMKFTCFAPGTFPAALLIDPWNCYLLLRNLALSIKLYHVMKFQEDEKLNTWLL